MKTNRTTGAPEAMLPSHLTAATLRDQIRQGHYAVGDRLSSEPTLAKKLGVNRGTIRKALDILQNEHLITRQPGYGTFVSNPAYGRAAKTDVSLIGAMVWEKEYYFGAIIQEAFAYSASRGYMLMTSSNAIEDTEKLGLEAFIKNGVAGVILAPVAHSATTYKKLTEAGIPVVLIDRYCNNSNEDFVSVDDQQGTCAATQHLIELGHTKLAYVGHNIHTDTPCHPARLAGFVQACKQSGIIVPENRFVETSIHIESYLPKLRQLLSQDDRPTGIVTYNDQWAVWVVQTARELHLRVPEDISVTGFDDSKISRNYDIPITTVSPEPHAVGVAATELLIKKIEDKDPTPKRKILISPNLIIRASTARLETRS